MAEPKNPKAKSKFIEIEEKTLDFWAKNDTFKKSLAGNGTTKNSAAKKGKEFVFYDGPPFATGVPHYGHFLASFIKDTIPRYKAMQGYKVSRRWGWDCHGLPVENLVEKELGLKSKKDILDYGIEKFNDSARKSVLNYADEWRKQIPRIGRWVDMDNDYRTMDSGYTESVWWVFKSLFDKGLVYEGFKSMQICPRCETTLSNFEVNQGYKDITDISVYVKFKTVGTSGSDNFENTFFLAWTTTPWTLPGNVALAVGAEIDYAYVSHSGATYIIAHDRVAEVFSGKEHQIGKIVKGAELVGQKYIPIFPYYNNTETNNLENGFKVYSADFVTTTDGSGIVHIAPAFGEDDMKLGEKHNLPFIQHVGMDGRFKKEVKDFAGQEVKPKGSDSEKDAHQKTDIEVIKWLAHKGFLFEKKKIIHSYPHCWRCATPLLNYAASSWFVRVTAFKDKLIAANKKVSWTPDDIRDGRFGKWLEGARDWAISRSRFWGAPIPVWRGKTSGKIYTVGSVAELSKLIKRSGNTYTLLRHGESESNVLGISNSIERDKYHLTKKGRQEVAEAIEVLKKEGVDIIVASDFLRTEETARMVAESIGMDAKDISYDVRLREYVVGPSREGKLWRDTEAYVKKHGPYPGMEDPMHLRRRVLSVVYDLEKKYQNKKILIISHGSPLNTILNGVMIESNHNQTMHDTRNHFQRTAEMHKLDFVPLPHDENHHLDLHRPFIDKVHYVAPASAGKNAGEELVRVDDVFDCWFESGSMPYGEACYTGKAQEHFDPKGKFGGLLGGLGKLFGVGPKGFPADFIAEGLDQTRGWFYSMMVLGVGLFGVSPFKNVIVNGLILAEDGEKMSKSLKNYPDPMNLINTYGADALRYYLLSSPVVGAQDLKFAEKGVDDISKKLLLRLDNVLAFYELYADTGKDGKSGTVAISDSKNILDKWIRARLIETREEVTKYLDIYQLDKASRPLMTFVDDLSTWYLRRSRDRFKSDNESEKNLALGTTKYVLREFSKISAPFLPFYTEYLWGKLKDNTDAESVHLEVWPDYGNLDKESVDVIEKMNRTKDIVTLALQERAKANIKVRQPLASLSIKESLSEEYLALIKDEVNVKVVLVDSTLVSDLYLDVVVTPELKKEGVIRDLIRAIQDLRKTTGLTVNDSVQLLLDSDEKGKELVHAYMADIKRVTLVTGVKYDHLPQTSELAIEEYRFKIGIDK